MLDALLAALPDSAYFEHRNTVETYRENLRTSVEPFACYLRGPAHWNTLKNSSYPIYALCKSNTVDNPVFAPFLYGSIVISSAETGELLVYLAADFGGKTPKEIPPAPAKPKHNLPRAKTYSVDDHWRILDIKEMRGGFGHFQAFLHAGDFQSKAYPFQVVGDPAHPKAAPYEALLKAPSKLDANGKPNLGIAGATVSLPATPTVQELGVTLIPSKEKSGTKPDHFPISGTFKFTGAWPKEYAFLPLHFLIAGQDARELVVKTLWLPRSKCHLEAGPNANYSGMFSFDLANFFLTAWDGKAKLPKHAWISMVHRGWQGPIVKYDFNASP